MNVSFFSHLILSTPSGLSCRRQGYRGPLSFGDRDSSLYPGQGISDESEDIG